KAHYKHLLIPRAGGMAFTLAAMNGQLRTLLVVTVYSPQGVPRYWDYDSGKVESVRVHLRQRTSRKSVLGEYANDTAFRQDFQLWVNEIWREKDSLLATIAQESASH